MARKRERITFRCELHQSINVAEAAMNRTIEHLWGEKWPPTPHRTKISATKIKNLDRDIQVREVTFGFAGLPYQTARVSVRKDSPQEWRVYSVIIDPNPDLSDQDLRLQKGPIRVFSNFANREGELKVYDRDQFEEIGRAFARVVQY